MDMAEKDGGLQQQSDTPTHLRVPTQMCLKYFQSVIMFTSRNKRIALVDRPFGAELFSLISSSTRSTVHGKYQESYR